VEEVMPTPEAKKDFFISYTGADQQWAEWVGWVLKEAGYSVIIQAWDFHFGENFIDSMHRALEESVRTIAVLSPAYMESRHCRQEWTAALAKAAQDGADRLLPVRIADFQPPGALAPIVYIDLVGANEAAARKKLLDGVKQTTAKPSPIGTQRPALQRPALRPIPEAERHISVWISERPEGLKKPLQVGEVYTLNFKVGQPVQASLLSGPEAIVPSSDVPPEGLPTEWVITSSTVELAEVTPDTFVTNLPLDGTTVWMARFSLLIPKEEESAVPQLLITPRSARNTGLNVVIYAKKEIYRQFTVQLAMEELTSPEEATLVEAITIGNELLHAPAAHLGLRTTHEWTTPPGELSIAVVGQALAYVRGDAGPTFLNQMTKWSGVQAKVAGPVTTQVPNLLRNNDLHSEHLKNGSEKPVSVGANHDIW
jgi:hypothetical protein